MSEATAPATPKSKKKLALIVAGVLLLAAGGAGAAWYALQQPGLFSGSSRSEEAPPRGAKPLYQPLETFTVNLHDGRGDRYAQIGITLQYDRPDLEATLKDRMPALRNDILLLLSAKQPEELLSPEGKQQLAQQIRVVAGKTLGFEERRRRAVEDDDDEAPRRRSRNPIQAVLFSQFIVQ